VELIEREELKAKLDRGDDFKLVLTLNQWAFEAMRIPGSVNITCREDAEGLLSPDDDIVVYCSDPACLGSRVAYRWLTESGFEHVRRYAGGLNDWQSAGFPLEGTMVD
jgi:rhodanese-related sulfurtransferase